MSQSRSSVTKPPPSELHDWWVPYPGHWGVVGNYDERVWVSSTLAMWRLLLQVPTGDRQKLLDRSLAGVGRNGAAFANGDHDCQGDLKLESVEMLV